ncbi:MAG: hypothetical protein R3F24_06520 [Gammaproteobacteria bacterium]
MRIQQFVVVLMMAGAMVACGSKQPDKPGGPAAASGGAAKAAPSGNATAEQVAEEARGDIDCPAKIKTPAPPDGAPVIDVVGVRPGLTYEEAANIVACTNDLMVVGSAITRGINMQTYGQTIRQGFTAQFAEPRVQKTSKQIIQEMQDEAMARGSNRRTEDMAAGTSRWYVGTMGMPGQERVINAARKERFAEGKNPTLASLEKALVSKYGTPTKKQIGGNYFILRWAYDLQGRPITETSPLANKCTGSSSPDGGVSYSPDCGVVVEAQANPLRENPDLAEWLQVGVVDDAGGYDAITRTEQALQQGENERRARQTEDAAKNADAPQL